MAFAEARAAWQRAANRCFVQEDAKRAPKLASSLTPSTKETELEPSSAVGSQEIASAVFVLFNPEPSYNLSPTNKWWLQMQPNNGYFRGLIDEKLTVMDSDEGKFHFREGSEDFVSSLTDFVMVDQPSAVKSVLSDDFPVKEESFRASSYDMDSSVRSKLGDEVSCRKKGEGVIEALVSSNDILFDSDTSWSGGGKSGPWWQTDAEELALLVSQRSQFLVENCDLPLPQNLHAKKGLSANRNSFVQHKTFTSSVQQDLAKTPSLMSSNDSTAGNMASDISIQKNGLPSERHSTETCGESPPKTNKVREDTAQLLEALRHSQTRARESEKAAKEACAEKEHIVKLLLRQASQLFAYKQWFQLLQLENNTYLQGQSQQTSPLYPIAPLHHYKPSKSKNWRKPAAKKRQHIVVCEYAIAFAWGIGLVGAGLMLGWSIAWIPPPW